MIMARERPVAGAMRVVQEPQARPDLLRRLCQVQAGGLEGAARGEPSQSSSTLCSESHVMTTHLHSSWRKPHLPCDPFELSASMRRLSRLRGPGPDDVDLRLSGSRVLLQRPECGGPSTRARSGGREGNVEGDRLRGIGHIAGLCHAARLPPVPPLELDFNTDEGDGPVGLDSKVLNAAGVVQAKAVQEPLQGRQAWARIQESARLRDGLSAGRRASGWSGEELRSRPGRRPPQNVAPKVLGSRGCSTCFDSKHSGRQASCIQAFEPVWLREKRLGFWQETASCPLTRFIIAHCAVDPTTYVAAPNTEGYMTSVAGIVEYIARTEGPDTSAAVGADIENGRLDETLAGFGSCQPALEAIAIPVAQFKDPAPDVGPFLVKPHTKGKGKRTRNSAPAFLPPSPPPRPPSSARPAAHRRDAAAPAPPRPGAVLTAIQGFGAQQEAERRALAARQAREAEERRQALWAQRLQATIAFRAELDSGFRAGQIAGAEASERWRAFEAESAGWRRASATATGARRARRPRTTRASGTCTTEAPRRYFFSTLPQFGPAMAFEAYPAHYSLGALAATLTWLLGGTPTASAVIGVGFGYAAKSLYAPGGASQAAAGMRPAGR
eukprot:tig00000507_g1759.t1